MWGYFFLEMHLEYEASLQLPNIKFYSTKCNGFTFRYFFFLRFLADFLQYEAKLHHNLCYEKRHRKIQMNVGRL